MNKQPGLYGSFFIVLLGLILFIPFAALIVIIDGVLFSLLWRWFISPIFEIRPISILEAAGLATIVSYFRVKGLKTQRAKWWFVAGLFTDLTIVLIAFIIHLFI